MGVADEMRAERKARRGYDPDDPFDQEAAKRDFSRDRHKRARSDERSHREAYQEGVKEERQRAERRPSSKPKAKRRPAHRTLRRQARQVAQPVRAQVGSGLHFFGLTLAATALYLLLSTEADKPGAVSGLVALPANAIRWLASPAHSIPAKPAKH